MAAPNFRGDTAIGGKTPPTLIGKASINLSSVTSPRWFLPFAGRTEVGGLFCRAGVWVELLAQFSHRWRFEEGPHTQTGIKGRAYRVDRVHRRQRVSA